jgi:cytochrome c biogenesis protein CcdA
VVKRLAGAVLLALFAFGYGMAFFAIAALFERVLP